MPSEAGSFSLSLPPSSLFSLFLSLFLSVCLSPSYFPPSSEVFNFERVESIIPGLAPRQQRGRGGERGTGEGEGRGGAGRAVAGVAGNARGVITRRRRRPRDVNADSSPAAYRVFSPSEDRETAVFITEVPCSAFPAWPGPACCGGASFLPSSLALSLARPRLPYLPASLRPPWLRTARVAAPRAPPAALLRPKALPLPRPSPKSSKSLWRPPKRKRSSRCPRIAQSSSLRKRFRNASNPKPIS